MNGLIRYARFLGSFPTSLTADWTLAGQDGGQSIELGGEAEETLFVFSDSLFVLPDNLQPASPSRLPFEFQADEPFLFLPNCAALTQGRDWRSALAALRYIGDAQGLPRTILPTTPAEERARLRLWPAHGLRTAQGVFLFYLGIQTVDPSTMWGFRNQGVGLARLDPHSWETERIYQDGHWRMWHSPADDFHFGVQVVRQGDEAYVFGSVRHGFETSAILARVPIDQLSEPSAYRYLTGPDGGWSIELSEAGSLGPCGSDYSISFNRYLRQYLMVYVDSFTKVLSVRLAGALCGPYSPPQPLGRVPHRLDSELIYLGFEHPAFSKGDGEKVYVSYCQPFFTPSSVIEVCFR